MATANWVCSHYWLSEQWSTAAEPRNAGTRRFGGPGSAHCRCCAFLPPLAVDHLDGTHDLREDAELRGVGRALPARANRFS